MAEIDEQYTMQGSSKTDSSDTNEIINPKQNSLLQPTQRCSTSVEEKDNDTMTEASASLRPYAECSACSRTFDEQESFLQHLTSDKHRKKTVKAKMVHQMKSEAIPEVFIQNSSNGKTEEEPSQSKLVSRSKPDESTEKPECSYSKQDDSEHLSEEEFDAIFLSHKFECTICNKTFTGVESWFQHIASKTHERALKKTGMLEDLLASEENFPYLDAEDEILSCKMCHMVFSGPESATDHLKSKGHIRKRQNREWNRKHRQNKVKTAQISSKCSLENPKAQIIHQKHKSETKTSSTYGPKVSSFDFPEALKEVKSDHFHQGLGMTFENQPMRNENLNGETEIKEAVDNSIKTLSDKAANDVITVKNCLPGYENYIKYKKLINEAKSEDIT